MLCSFVYVLESTDNGTETLYTGYTNDLKRRLKEHNCGGTKTTKNSQRRCIYYEACLNQADAERRERYLKTTLGKRLIKRRLKEYFY
ncbi:excinuclease ABC subunit C [bacterium]|nr:excinuclease ABC subunit C [bacterium]